MVHKLDQKLEKEILEYLKDHSQGATARKFKVGKATVNKIAKGSPTIKPVLERSDTKNATAARIAYARQDRLQVLHKLMRRVDMAIDDPELKPGNIKDLTIALGTLLDKYRLEEKDTDDKSTGEIHDLLTAWKGADARTA